LQQERAEKSSAKMMISEDTVTESVLDFGRYYGTCKNISDACFQIYRGDISPFLNLL
jgi:hypothetical protein